ncbi:prepilin-type N-terminal cleavage/methylation domain-containing protein [Candidatus Parcubacteria bacterium]|nr:prepilin-type N-terminal cleavage/methylation domain-containing protein [Candidatus Parcubacteria bacterium]
MKKAFTLIEILVVLGIFSIFVVGAINVYLSAVRVQSRAISMQQMLEQINFALEYMGREIRMAKKDDVQILNFPPKHCCPGDKVNYCTSNQNTQITFRNSKNNCHTFFLSSNQIFEKEEGTQRELTSLSAVRIKNLKFIVTGEGQEDKIQPKVTILIETAPTFDPQTSFYFQTTISQRDLDIEISQ